MNIAVETIRRRGARALRADFIPTPKNGVISELYPDLGFQRLEAPSPADGTIRWLLDLATYVPRQTHIHRSGATT